MVKALLDAGRVSGVRVRLGAQTRHDRDEAGLKSKIVAADAALGSGSRHALCFNFRPAWMCDCVSMQLLAADCFVIDRFNLFLSGPSCCLPPRRLEGDSSKV